MRIIVGKRGEHTLLMRNDDKGPILQSVFYDFNGELKSVNNGKYIINIFKYAYWLVSAFRLLYPCCGPFHG